MTAEFFYDVLERIARQQLRPGPGLAGQSFVLSKENAARLTREAWAHLEPFKERRTGEDPIEAVRLFGGRLRVPVVVVEDAPADLVVLLPHEDARRCAVTPRGPGGRR